MYSYRVALSAHPVFSSLPKAKQAMLDEKYTGVHLSDISHGMRGMQFGKGGSITGEAYASLLI